VLHGNIFDLFPVQENGGVNYVPLKTFLTRRLFPDRSCLLFYDISGGLTFGSPEMQKMFFEWLEIFDSVENTNFHQQGPPKEFEALACSDKRYLPERYATADRSQMLQTFGLLKQKLRMD